MNKKSAQKQKRSVTTASRKPLFHEKLNKNRLPKFKINFGGQSKTNPQKPPTKPKTLGLLAERFAINSTRRLAL